MARATNWCMAVLDKTSVAVKAVYGSASGSVTLQDLGAQTANLAQVDDSTITLRYDKIVDNTYFNCVDASFVGRLPACVLEDFVQIFIQTEGSSTYNAYFFGRAKIIANTNHPDSKAMMQYRIVGLEDELDDAHDLNAEFDTATTLSALATSAFSYIAGRDSTNNNISGNLTEIFNPNYSSVKDTLEYIRQKVSGSAWGFTPRRVAYFRTIDTTAISIDENFYWQFIEWPSLQMGEYFNQVRFLIGKGTNSTLFEPASDNPLRTDDNLTYKASISGPYDKCKTVGLPEGFLPLSPVPCVYTHSAGLFLVSFGPDGTQDDPADLTRASDDLSRSYLSIYDAEIAFSYGRTALLRATPSTEINARDIAAIEIDARLSPLPDLTVGTNFGDNIKWTLQVACATATAGEYILFEKVTNGTPFTDGVDGLFTAGDRGRLATVDENVSYVEVRLISERTDATFFLTVLFALAVESLKLYTVNESELDDLAALHYVAADDYTAVATYGGIQAIRSKVDLITAARETFSGLDVSQAIIKLAANEGEYGAQTEYLVGLGASQPSDTAIRLANKANRAKNNAVSLSNKLVGGR